MNRTLKSLVWFLIATPLLYLAYLWPSLPERVPMHYDLHGNVDRVGAKEELVFLVLIITAVNVGVYLLLKNAHLISPKKHSGQNTDRMLRMGFTVATFISAILCFILYSTIYGLPSFFPGIVLSFVGLLLSIMGNYMYNIRPNYVAGFRMPWTLRNDDNWKRTHRVGGKLWFIGGLLIAAICPFLPFIPAIIVFFSMMIIITVIPLVYSYRIHKDQTRMH